jgi:hypothetical protein
MVTIKTIAVKTITIKTAAVKTTLVAVVSLCSSFLSIADLGRDGLQLKALKL